MLAGLLLPACAMLPIEPELKVRPFERQRPFRLALASPVVPGEAVAAEDGSSYRPALKQADVVEGLATGLAGVFRGVFRPSVLPGQDKPDAEGDLAFLAAADQFKGDYLYRVSIDRYAISYDGTNRWFWPAVAVGSYLWFPYWVIADEDYRADLEATLRVYSVATRELLAEVRFAEKAKLRANEKTKGWTVLGTLLNLPGYLRESNWLALDAVFRPVVLAKLRDAVADYEPPPLPPKSVALLVGVSNYRRRDRVPPVQAASHDVGELAGALTAHRSGEGVPAFLAPNVDILSDGAASRERMMVALEELAERAKPQDVVLVYFAGRAAVGGGGQEPAPGGSDPGPGVRYLLPWDADPEALAATAIRVDELREALARVPSRSLILVLDTSFAADSKLARALDARQVAAAALPPLRPEELLPPGPGRVCWMSCSDGEGALDRGDRGLFTSFLIEALEGKADADADRVTDWGELDRYVRLRMEAVLAPRGLVQTPSLFPAEQPADRAWLAVGGAER